MKAQYKYSIALYRGMSDDHIEAIAKGILDHARAFCQMRLNFAYWTEGVCESATHSIAVYQIGATNMYAQRFANDYLEDIVRDWAKEILNQFVDEIGDYEDECFYTYTVTIIANDFAGGFDIVCKGQEGESRSLAILPEKKDAEII